MAKKKYIVDVGNLEDESGGKGENRFRSRISSCRRSLGKTRLAKMIVVRYAVAKHSGLILQGRCQDARPGRDLVGRTQLILFVQLTD